MDSFSALWFQLFQKKQSQNILFMKTFKEVSLQFLSFIFLSTYKKNLLNIEQDIQEQFGNLKFFFDGFSPTSHKPPPPAVH